VDIQSIIDHTAATAGPAMRANFVHPAWVMSATEFGAFWAQPRMAGFGTVSPTGRPHVAALEVSYRDGRFHVPTFANAVRLADIRANPSVSLVAWSDAYHAMTIYGTARILSSAAAMVTVEVTPTRIYAIRPPAGHHAAGHE
jgi:predicted pyridoxine 5'-phosphate oxidase superfamily flavin-nucleotide-binding protein